jgi:hypothetical protein
VRGSRDKTIHPLANDSLYDRLGVAELKRIIVFRFHKLPELCADRIQFLKRLNPELPVFGLFGGEPEQLPDMERVLGPHLQHIFSIAKYAPGWKWRFSDLALREWFRSVGIGIAFDVAHLVEWDLLLCRPIQELYAHVPFDSMGVTAPRSVIAVEKDYHPTATEPLSIEWQNLKSWARETFSYSMEPQACLGPGYCVPRDFLEGYSHISMPELSIDELRVPLAAQLLGIPLSDTRLCRGWFMAEEQKIFNTLKIEVTPATVACELTQPRGRRAFHPFRASLSEVRGLLAQGQFNDTGFSL